MTFGTVILLLVLTKIEVLAYDMRVPLFNRRPLSVTNRLPATNFALQHHISFLQKPCNVLNDCSVQPVESTSNAITNIGRNFQSVARDQFQDNVNSSNNRTAHTRPIFDVSSLSRMMDQSINANMIFLPIHRKLDGYPAQNIEHSRPFETYSKLNLKLDNLPTKRSKVLDVITENSTDVLLFPNSSLANPTDEAVTTVLIDVQRTTVDNSMVNVPVTQKFLQNLDTFERKFYAINFRKLSLMAPSSRRENGMSYVQSGLFLQLALMALSTEVGPETKREIDDCLELDFSDQKRLDLINETVSSLPVSSDDLKFRWSSRLVLRSQEVSDRFRTHAASTLRLQIDTFNGTETPKEMADALNQMVEVDSGGAIHNTFEEDEVPADVRAVLLSTLYVRARWRSAPTLLNGTHAFYDAAGPRRSARMIRINDIMRYARLDHWDAEALEIFYSTPGLSLLMLVPQGSSLQALAGAVVNTSLDEITAQMQSLRVAATLPLYTLRMTLLLPNKLQAMNISRLVETDNEYSSELRLSLAVQRIMFWAEAGRNAFKDDGLEWDEPPQRELIVDRPYIFYVRWKNKTIISGNFVL